MSNPPTDWIAACAADAIEPEDVIRFDHGGQTYAIYRTAADRYYATAGHCTHAPPAPELKEPALQGVHCASVCEAAGEE